MTRFRVGVAAVAIGATLVLSGCFFPSGSGPLQLPPSPDASAGGGPQDWESLPHCQNGPPDPWVLVDDFPTELVESAGIQAECGDSYLAPDLPAYVSIADSSVTLDELQSLAAALEAAGYLRTGDTFEPKDEGDPADSAGGWEYTLDGDNPAMSTIMYVINFWSGGARGTYFTYLDFESPTTRVLG